MFGSTNNTAKPLFGSTTTTNSASPFTLGASATNTSSPFTLGGSNNNNTTNQQQQGGNMFSTPAFGQTTTNTQPAQGGSLFGTNTTNSAQQPTTSLFGNTSNTTNQQSGGGLFGSGTAQSQPQQTGSLFGGQNTASNASGTTSLFGQTTNNTQTATQNKPTLSLFGNNNNSNNTSSTAQPSTSLFGSSTAQTQSQQPTTSLFGTSTNTRPLGSTLGQTGQNTTQQTVPGVKIDLSNIRGTTRFNDLHDDVQKQIEALDNFITQQIQFKEQCDALMPSHGESLSTIPNDVSFVQSKLETTELALDNDTAAIDAMKAVIRKDADNARLSFRAVENLKLPQQFHYSGMWQTNASSPSGTSGSSDNGSGPVDLVSFVSSTADEFSKALAKYQGHVAEIEAHLGTLEANVVFQSQQLMFGRGRDGGVRGRDEQIRELGAVLREFDDGIMKVARRVGQVKEEALGVVEAGATENGGGRFAR